MNRITCISCDKKINTIYVTSPDIITDNIEGMSGVLHAEYGSEFDGDSFIIAVCDDCIKSKKPLTIEELHSYLDGKYDR